MSSNGQCQKHLLQARDFVGHTLHGGEYLIQHVLHEGLMQSTFLVHYVPLNIPFVLKQVHADCPLPAEFVTELRSSLLRGCHAVPRPFSMQCAHRSSQTDSFLREALVLARLKHRSIPTLYECFAEDGYWYLVTDYAPGPTLSMYVRKHTQLPPLEALNYAMQLCDVLEYLHRQTPPIIFGDLVSARIILTPDGSLMLIGFDGSHDFWSKSAYGADVHLSSDAPVTEQDEIHTYRDECSDLRSLGVLLYEMLSGICPAEPEIFQLPSHQALPDVSPVLSALIALATSTEPKQRFQSAQTLFLALERVYTLEEKRTYQWRVEKVVQKGHLFSQEKVSAPDEFEGTALQRKRLSSPPFFNLSQRRQIQRVIYQRWQENQTM